MLLWPLKDILPWDFQYLGLLFAFNCVLQLCFGYRISWHLTEHSRLIAIAGALLFLVAPPFVFRSSGHFPLTSHWLILAALTLYFTSSAAPAKWRLAAGAALCFLAATIHAYIMVMVLLIDAGAHLRAAMSSKEIAGTSLGARLYWIGLRVGISLASAIVGLIIFGLLRPLELRAYAESGYGAFSMNLLAPIDPGEFGALVLKPQPEVGIFQYEGYNYLGLGGDTSRHAGACASPFTICQKPLQTRGGGDVAHLRGISVSCSLVEGHGRKLDISVPLPVFEALSAFRASGRFFWPAYYLLLSGVIALAFAAFGRRWAALALSCALLIQVADTRSLYNFIQARWNSTSAHSFTDGADWQTLGRSHAHLIVEPPWQCNDANTPGGRNSFWTFGILAAKLNMTINSFFAGRLILLSQKVAGDCHWESVIEGDSHFSI
jgi:hypothetical protein